MNKFAFEKYVPQLIEKLEVMVKPEYGVLSMKTKVNALLKQLKRDLRERQTQIIDAEEGLAWLQGG